MNHRPDDEEKNPASARNRLESPNPPQSDTSFTKVSSFTKGSSYMLVRTQNENKWIIKANL
jgi:hypothetical protein